MKQLIVLTISMICITSAHSQTWQWGARGGGGSNGNTNDAETVLDMTTDNAGNVYLIARFESGGGATITGLPNSVGGYGLKDVLIASYNCNGVFRWKKVLGGAGNDGYKPMTIGTDTLGNVYITGMGGQLPPPLPPYHFDTDSVQPSTNLKQFIVVQYDTAGTLKWIRWPTPDTVSVSRQTLYSPRDMIVNPNGDIEILCHLERGLLSGSNIVVDTPSAYILKYDINGNITGLVKPDLNWRQVAGDGQNPTSIGNIRMAKTKSGKYVVSGWQSFNPLSPATPLVMGGQQIINRMFAALFESNWQNIWKKQNTNSIDAGAIAHRPMLDNFGNIILVGGTNKDDVFAGYTVTNTLTPNNVGLPAIYKLDTLGNLLFGKNMEANTTCSSVGAVGNEIYVAGGFNLKIRSGSYSIENPPNSSRDVYFARFELQNGNIIKLDSLKGPSGYTDDIRVMTKDNIGNVYLGGELGQSLTVGSSTLQSAGGNSDFFIAKYGNADCRGTLVPVRLVSFAAALQDRQVLTRWQTAQEQNTKAFIVERSGSAITFQPIGTVAAKGNSNVLQSYSFTDIDPLSSNSLFTTHYSLYYRLKILDFDGSYTYSSIAKINLSSIKGISIYPNPARSVVVVSYTQHTRNRISIEACNQLGQRMPLNVGGDANIGRTNSGSTTINIAGWPAGIYNVVLRSNGMVVGSEKLVVER